MEDEDFDVSAALLRLGGDAPDMASDLMSRLVEAVPDHAIVKRQRLRRRSELVVDLDTERFRMEVEGRHVRAWVDHVVRGICVRSDQLAVEQWLDHLGSGLARAAKADTTLRLALEQGLS